MLVKINRTVNMINLIPSLKYISWHENKQYFNQPGGAEHYKLLAYIAMQMPKNSIIVDLGTFYGSSAIALSYNPEIEVHTYDIVDLIPKDVKPTLNDIPNVKRYIKDCKECISSFKDNLVIVLDVDPHDGIQEKQVIQALVEIGYKGLVVCDDINLNQGMRDFWDSVSLKKHDVTKYGHWTGTGVIVFDPQTIDVLVE
jgi:predicted O-methyltransferase YrrM